MHPLSTTPETIETATRSATQAAPVPTTRATPKFSSNRDIAVVQADYLALSNDLEQAQALASVLEMQLSGKTNELAQFKLIWERTQTDLAKFAQDLDTMRQERHSLANEVQCAYAIEHKYEKLKLTHGELAAKAERLEAELLQERAAHAQSRAEAEELRAKASSRPAGPANLRDPEMRRSLEVLREQLNRVLGTPLSMVVPPAPVFLKPENEHIDIEFGA